MTIDDTKTVRKTSANKTSNKCNSEGYYNNSWEVKETWAHNSKLITWFLIADNGNNFTTEQNHREREAYYKDNILKPADIYNIQPCSFPITLYIMSSQYLSQQSVNLHPRSVITR